MKVIIICSQILQPLLKIVRVVKFPLYKYECHVSGDVPRTLISNLISRRQEIDNNFVHTYNNTILHQKQTHALSFIFQFSVWKATLTREQPRSASSIWSLNPHSTLSTYMRAPLSMIMGKTCLQICSLRSWHITSTVYNRSEHWNHGLIARKMTDVKVINAGSPFCCYRLFHPCTEVVEGQLCCIEMTCRSPFRKICRLKDYWTKRLVIANRILSSNTILISNL